MQPQSFNDLVQNSGNLGQQVASTVKQLAPYTSGYSTGTDTGMTVTQKAATASNGSVGNLGKFTNFVTSVAKGGANIAASIGKFAFKAAIDTVEAPFKAGYGIAQLALAADKQQTLSMQVDSLNQQQHNLTTAYSAGRISQQQYNAGMKQMLVARQDISKSIAENQSRIVQGGKNAISGVINTAGDVIAIITAGAGAPLETAIADKGTSAAVDFLMKSPFSKALESSAAKIDQATSYIGKGAAKITGSENSFSLQTMDQVTKEATQGASASLSSQQIAKNVAVNLLLKKPLIYQTTISSATDAYKELINKKYGSAVGNMALLAGMALAGGPIGFALEKFAHGSEWLKAAMFTGGDPKALANELTTSQAKSISRQSFIDALSSAIGDKNPAGIYNELMARLAKGEVESYQMVKITENVNMQMSGGNSVAAANKVLDFLNSLDGGKATSEMSHGDMIDSLVNWAKTRQAMVEAAKDGRIDGVKPADAERIVIGRANVSDLNFIQQFMRQADEQSGSNLLDRAGARHNMFSKLIERYGQTAAWANSDTFLKQVSNILATVQDTQKMIDALNNIKLGEEIDGVPSELRDMARKNGFIAILPRRTRTPYTTFEQTNKNLRTAFAGEIPKTAPGKDLFVQAVKPLPVLQSIGSFLTKIGLSPESSGTAVQQIFKQNLASALPSDLDADMLMKSLADYTKNPTVGILRNAPITDYRQMSIGEIMKAANISKEDAKKVMKAIHTAMLKVPLQVRGLGDKVMDLNYAVNPAARVYSRVQGAARFTYNPFFRWQQTTQTEFLAQMETGGKKVAYPAWNKANELLFPGQAEKLNNTVQLLEQQKIFGSGFSGALAGNESVGTGAIGTRLLKGEKLSLAGLTNIMAERVGLPVDKFIEQYHSDVIDVLRTIVQYPTKGGFLNSPLARTINLAFFPFRYNMKIAGLVAKQVSRLSAPMQVAIIKNLFQMDSFLKSDEGIAWYSKHSDAIKLFQWLSPLYPLTYVQKILSDAQHPSDATIGDFGLLGGLPFGFISQMLDSNGIIHLNLPYVDPKNGKVFPDYIPNSLKAEANLAIQDLLGQTFSYPGATAGLPSKGSILRNVAGGLVPGSNKEFTPVDQTNKLTPEQEHERQVIEQQNGAVIGANGQQVNTWSGATIPTTILAPDHPAPPVPAITHTTNQPVVRTKTKKKSEYIPRPAVAR